jgi:hypothetical protein
MNSRAFFESLWAEPVTAEEEQPPLCRYAASFQPWAQTLVEVTLQRSTTVSINQAKVLLLDKYFEWRAVSPKPHRDKMSGSGHVCLFAVFEAAYRRLKEAELSLTPPQLIAPTPPPSLPAPSPPPPIPGIFLGEEE